MMGEQELLRLLKLTDRFQIDQLFREAYEVKVANVGNKVYFRGIIEFSNVCRKDCYYCGIRKSNTKVRRFRMSKEEILESARWAYENRYGSVVLQSGERIDEKYVDFVDEVIHEIKAIGNGKLGITLSLGEQSPEVYQRWFKSGAHRYLLRIETSSPELYAKLHPGDHSFETRKNCLRSLKEIGYQVGTGVMIGLPFQTHEDLVKDILFFKEMDIDMIGMGPYLVHSDTPLAGHAQQLMDDKQRLELGLKMIAVTRLYLKDVNIASTTALQALSPIGRELGLKAGANIIMPIITDQNYRGDYKLYDNKPCIEDTAAVCRSCLEGRIRSVGEEIGYAEWGDSPHAKKPK